jgi:hypothetical protein
VEYLKKNNIILEMIVSLKQGDNATLVFGDYVKADPKMNINEKHKILFNRIQFLNGFYYWHFNTTKVKFGDDFTLSDRPIATIMQNTFKGILIFT